MNAIVAHNGQEFRQSTDAAGLCGAIVKQTASKIQGRRYVTVEGWQAIAIAHGCAASALDVERVNDEGMSGFRCVGVVRRMDDGQEIARGEGFLGDDEGMWAKRPVYARRAMVQTRAISRACRSAFAHVVVMIDAGLSTTPAEEVPEGGFVEGQFQEVQSAPNQPADPHHVDPEPKPAKGPQHSALKTQVRRFVHELNGCGDSDELTAFLATPDALKVVSEVREKLPDWWTGWPEQPDGFTPLSDLITKRQHECAEVTASYATV